MFRRERGLLSSYYCFVERTPWAYHGEIAPMVSTESAPLSKHMIPKICIIIASAKKIMIMQLIVARYYYS